ncbi:hypothetical protein [Streptomyces sp. cmx-4-9]|uniref:hypothetical protein n=1 Tax=Streptomyces sp. cmx-4-9 TaxID=2790941 RepID=UPI00398104BF
MTAWQVFAGAGLVAAMCPLHGHVAVAGDGNGRGARIDVCVPAGHPRPPGARPTASLPAPSVVTAGPGGPTVHHPGRPARPARPAGPPRPATPPDPAVPPAAAPEPPRPAPAAAARGQAPAARPAVPAAASPAAARPAASLTRAGAFHVRPYRAVAVARRGPGGMSTVMLMVVVTTPAVLAAAALRPRGRSAGRS